MKPGFHTIVEHPTSGCLCPSQSRKAGLFGWSSTCMAQYKKEIKCHQHPASPTPARTCHRTRSNGFHLQPPHPGFKAGVLDSQDSKKHA
eukprot:3624493-Ditylum_brightwellii.AAC.2